MYLEPLKGAADHTRLLAQLSLRVACFLRGPPRFLSPAWWLSKLPQHCCSCLFPIHVSWLLFYMAYIMIYLGETKMKKKTLKKTLHNSFLKSFQPPMPRWGEMPSLRGKDGAEGVTRISSADSSTAWWIVCFGGSERARKWGGPEIIDIYDMTWTSVCSTNVRIRKWTDSVGLCGSSESSGHVR